MTMMTFLSELTNIAIKEGFEDASALVNSMVMEAATIADIQDFIEAKYNLYYSYRTYYNNLRPMIKVDYVRDRDLIVWSMRAKELGFGSTHDLAVWLAKRSVLDAANFLQLDINKTIEIISRFVVGLAGDRRISRAKSKHGFRRLKTLRRWEKQALCLGYDSVRQAFYFLEKIECLTVNQISGLFGVDRKTYYTRRKAMNYPIKKHGG